MVGYTFYAEIIIDKCYLAETEAQFLSSGMSQKLTQPHGPWTVQSMSCRNVASSSLETRLSSLERNLQFGRPSLHSYNFLK